MNAAAAIIGHVRGRFRSQAGRRLVWSMAAAIAARGSLLVLAVVLARQLGPSGYGTFTFATGMALLAAQIAVLGWPQLMNRMIPPLLRDRDWPRLKGLRDMGDAVVFTASLGAALILAALSLLFPKLSEGFLLGALLTVPFALAILRRQQLAAVRLPGMGLLFDQGFGAILTVAVLLALGGGQVLGEAVLFFGAMIVVGVVVTTIVFRRRLPPELAGAERRFEFRAWMAIALPILVGLSSRIFMNKTDVLMLAPLSNMHEVGLYGAAFRITYVLTFPQVVMMSVVTPLFSEAFAHERHRQVRRLLGGALLFAAVTALPFSLALVLFPELVMTSLFGEAFAPAAPTLALLAVGQLATSLAIPFGGLLTMGGRERVFGGINLAGLALHVALNFLLVPTMGATGAAIATLCVAVSLLVTQVIANRAILAGRQR
ncbi:MAG TPA: polysaccharide biosynthesis C-terminal domain-containing protein [Allosphingosinicella sp.]